MNRYHALRAWNLMLAAVLCHGAAVPPPLGAQADGSRTGSVDPKLYDGLRYRSLGFSRGGRSTAVAGVPGKPLTYYFGSTGGGVWRTDDAGTIWKNVSDGFIEAGSIGAIAVADSDPNVVYVGTGSACPRGNISEGVGMYRSSDGGKSWVHIGLRDAGLIGRIRVHPKDENLVYAAVLGRIFGPGEERGVYRSRDGGKTWHKVLFVSSRTGAVDLSMDPSNPRILYAAMWTAERKPWDFIGGGEESGLYRSRDGGDTWTKLSGGLPAGAVGRIGVSVSPADRERVFALVEADGSRGGVFRSDDGGDSWRRVNSERRFLQRGWYYIHICADPKDAETVYVMNTGFYRSTDGGRTYTAIAVPHGDNHDLWIAPEDPRRMINANDGGANVSFNAGASWSGQTNQPTAEFYRITADNRFPYRVYGAQQDNSTVSVPSRGSSGGDDFYPVGGGESGHIAVDPRNPDIIWAGSYGGYISRMDVSTRLGRTVRAYPELSTGQRAADMKYRFQWNAPIRISPHDPDIVYHASQVVHRTRDGGHSWEVISPDLTRNDKSKQDYSGRPVARDNTGVEVFGTVFAFEESAKSKGLLWAGSDDGLIHVSRDGGASWKNVTPAAMPEFGTVNMIDPSPNDPARAFIAVHRYRQNDPRPYIFRTGDYGASWDLLTDGKNGIPANHFVRAVREDPARKGLLYAGTEFGLYISFDDGAHWQKFQLNLPVTPVTDLLVHRNDLLVATQGRAFWVLDDLTPLHQVAAAMSGVRAHMFTPGPGYRAAGFGVTLSYFLAEVPKDELTLEILEPGGRLVWTGSNRQKAAPDAPRGAEEGESGSRSAPRLPAAAGINRFVWNTTHAPVFEIPPRTVLWGGGGGGPNAVPGRYQARLKVGDWNATVPFDLLPDPRLPVTIAEYRQQYDLAVKVGEKIRDLYSNLLRLRAARKQAADLGELYSKAGSGSDVADASKKLGEKLSAVEAELTQTQGEGGQDALNFPGRLDNQLVTLYAEIAGGDGRPSAGSAARLADLEPLLDRQIAALNQIFAGDLAAFNKLVKSKGNDPVVLPK